jgi:hypothetical protein
VLDHGGMGRDNKIEVDGVAIEVDWLAIRMNWLAGMHWEFGSFKLKSQPITLGQEPVEKKEGGRRGRPLLSRPAGGLSRVFLLLV